MIGTACEMTPMPQPRMGHTGQKYQPPPPRPTASQMPSMSSAPAGVVVTQPAHREIGDQGVQFAGAVRGERPAQPVFVLRHGEVALGQGLSQIGGGPFSLAVPGADIGHGGLPRSCQ